MKCHFTGLLLACLLTACVTPRQSQEAAFSGHAQTEMQLLQYAARFAASAEVCTKLESIEPGFPKRRISTPLPEEEFQQLKDVLSRAGIAPYTGAEARNWSQEDLSIRLYDPAGTLLIELNKHILSSYSNCLNGSNSLLCLPDNDMGVLMALPTLQQAKKHMTTEDNYTAHCRLRSTSADKLKQALKKARSARILLENAVAETSEIIELKEEEYDQLSNILSQAQPLPHMTRAAWDAPSHCVSVPPLLVNASLELLDEQSEVIHALPLDYTCLARESEAESFREHEHNGEFAALPDDLHAAFYALPFWEQVLQARIELASH